MALWRNMFCQDVLGVAVVRQRTQFIGRNVRQCSDRAQSWTPGRQAGQPRERHGPSLQLRTARTVSLHSPQTKTTLRPAPCWLGLNQNACKSAGHLGPQTLKSTSSTEPCRDQFATGAKLAISFASLPFQTRNTPSSQPAATMAPSAVVAEQ